ncbi:putative PMR5 domain, PC-Esterase [Dioscorea sansibarensis]
MAKKNNQLFFVKLWGLRNIINFIVSLFLALAIILFISSTTKTGNAWGGGMESVEVAGKGDDGETCDLFSGKWVFDNLTYPLYSERECMFMSDQSACEKFGRKNLRYQNWRWQPKGCDLPRFNATRLLESLRDQRMVFVGDSLNRNQWVSMVCLLGSVIPSSLKSMETNGSLMSFKAKVCFIK